MSFLHRAAQFSVDTVYPKRCGGCGRRGSWVCPACDQALQRFAPPWCSRCGLPDTFSSCACDSTPHELSHVRSIGPYSGWIRGAIHALKYVNEWGRVEHFGPLVAVAAATCGPYDVIVPVPLHPSRLRRRGFNQSQLIANHVSRDLGVPIEPLLVRTRATVSQVDLNATERYENTRSAFMLARSIALNGRSVLLVDDVITTGSTLAACATVLRGAGATTVDAATIAREI